MADRRELPARRVARSTAADISGRTILIEKENPGPAGLPFRGDQASRTALHVRLYAPISPKNLLIHGMAADRRETGRLLSAAKRQHTGGPKLPPATTSMTRTIAVPAKINLFLNVLERRSDGYHEIRSVMAPVTPPADDVSLAIVVSPGIAVHCDDVRVPGDDTNLAHRAAVAFSEATGIHPQWHVTLAKSIPIAAGLGGGSADAAGILRLLNQHHQCPLSEDELLRVAVQVGADVPFFLDVGPVLAAGIGEKLEAISVGCELGIVLVNPGFPVSAAWAYTNWGRVPVPAPPPLEECLAALSQGSIQDVANVCYNALEFAVRDKFPVLDMVIEFLCSSGCRTAHVSGSGPTVFGVCDLGERDRICADVREGFGDTIWCCSTSVRAASP